MSISLSVYLSAGMTAIPVFLYTARSTACLFYNLSVTLSVRLPICICPIACLHILLHMSVLLTICMSALLPVCLIPVCMSISVYVLSICESDCLCICLCVCLSLSFSACG